MKKNQITHKIDEKELKNLILQTTNRLACRSGISEEIADVVLGRNVK